MNRYVAFLPVEPFVYVDVSRDKEEVCGEPSRRVAVTDSRISEDGDQEQADCRTVYHSNTPDIMASLLYPSPWMLYLSRHSSPKGMK